MRSSSLSTWNENADVAVQSYVATGSMSDDQLPRVCRYGSSNMRIMLEHVDSLNDFPDTARRKMYR